MSQEKEPLPVRLLKKYQKNHKQVFSIIDNVRLQKGKTDSFDWLDFCCIPIATTMIIMDQDYPTSSKTPSFREVI